MYCAASREKATSLSFTRTTGILCTPHDTCSIGCSATIVRSLRHAARPRCWSAMVQRTRTRMTWRSKRVRAGHHPSIGRGIEVVDSADKGRIVVANTTFRRKESILREPTLPLAMFGPGHCFRCAAGILRVNPDGTPAANAQGFCEAVPGTTRCLRCRRIFCSQACQASAQHQCECPVMAHVDTQTPADV